MSDIVSAAVEALNKRLDGQGFDGVAKFVIEGEGKNYYRHTSIRLDSGETIDFAAKADTELLLITLPLIEARAAA